MGTPLKEVPKVRVLNYVETGTWLATMYLLSRQLALAPSSASNLLDHYYVHSTVHR